MKKAFVIFALCFLSAYGYMHRWGGYALSMPALTIGQATGLISAGGLRTISSACQAHGRWECVFDAQMDLYQKTRNPDVLAELAAQKARHGHEAEALIHYGQWRQAGGKASKPAFDYAALLERAGQKEKAIELYAASAVESHDRLPVRATSAVVRMLMEQGRNQEAYDWLINFHSSAGNAPEYLAAERQALEDILKVSTKKKMASR